MSETDGRLLAIGDIHGCFTALTALERLVNFQEEDRLITLGDYVDRGPDSRAVVDWLIERHAGGSLVPLLGNHELMMLSANQSQMQLNQWLICGGDVALQSYSNSKGAANLDDVPEAHWEFLISCRPYYETKRHFFVHANADPKLPLDRQPDDLRYWEPFNDPEPHESGKTMICGHSRQKEGAPRNIGHAVCIDTGAYGGGWLTCLDVETGQYWQANQNSETRTGQL